MVVHGEEGAGGSEEKRGMIRNRLCMKLLGEKKEEFEGGPFGENKKLFRVQVCVQSACTKVRCSHVDGRQSIGTDINLSMSALM